MPGRVSGSGVACCDEVEWDDLEESGKGIEENMTKDWRQGRELTSAVPGGGTYPGTAISQRRCRWALNVLAWVPWRPVQAYVGTPVG